MPGSLRNVGTRWKHARTWNIASIDRSTEMRMRAARITDSREAAVNIVLRDFGCIHILQGRIRIVLIVRHMAGQMHVQINKPG